MYQRLSNHQNCWPIISTLTPILLYHSQAVLDLHCKGRSDNACWPFEIDLTGLSHTSLSAWKEYNCVFISAFWWFEAETCRALSRLTSPEPCGISQRETVWTRRRDAIIKHRQTDLFLGVWVGVGVRLSSETYLLLFLLSESSCWGVNEPATECLIGRGICLEVSRDLWRQLSRSSRAPLLGSLLIRQAHVNPPTPTPTGLRAFVFPVSFWVKLQPTTSPRCGHTSFLKEIPSIFFFLLEGWWCISSLRYTDGLHSKLWISIVVFASGIEATHWLINMSWAWVTLELSLAFGVVASWLMFELDTS